MTDEMSEAARKRFEEFEKMERELDRKDREREERHLQRLAELADQSLERQAEQMGDVAHAALQELERRLREWDLLADDDRFRRLCVPVRDTDEVFVGIELDGRRYSFSGVGTDDVIVQRWDHGHFEYATLDDGIPGPWSAPERDN